MSCSTTTSAQHRKADRELRDRWGTKHYKRHQRCPKCGTKNIRRKPDGTCLACSMKGAK